MGRLERIETVLLDLDGTLYVGSQVVPGAPEAVRWLRAQGLAVRFCTNTDSVTPVAVAARLLTSEPEARVLAVAAEGVRELLGDRLAGARERVSHVLVADPSYGAAYDDLDAAFQAVRDGAELLATQVNRVAVRDDGEHLDTGGWVRLLEYATGATARVLGKPSPEFFTAPWRRSAVSPQRRWSSGTTLRPTSGADRPSGRPPCWSAPARATPHPAPASNPTRSSTASPTCRTCSGTERRARPGKKWFPHRLP